MSIQELLKLNGMSLFPNANIEPTKLDNGKIYNPDIPGDTSGTEKNVKSNAYDKIKGQKNYLIFNNQRFDKLRSKPLNGDFLKLKFNTNYGAKSYNQQLEGSINPENIMRKINPIRAPAYDYVNGAEGQNFRELPSSVYESHNSVKLIQTARNSYASRLVSLGELPSLRIDNISINPIN
jgi:hypothetical protein